MDVRDWILVLAAVGHLTLALLSTSRARKSPLALPVALLAFDFFGWTFATFCNHRFGAPRPLWRTLDVAFTAMAPAVVLHIVLTFVGQVRRRASLLRATYAFFGVLAVSSLSAFFSEWGRAWIESPVWVVLFLGGWIPTLVYEVAILVRHLRSASDEAEVARTRLVLAALLVGGAFASTDLWHDIGVPLPALAPLGALVSTCLLVIVALAFRLFDRNLGSSTTLYAAVVAVSAILVYLTLFEGLHGNLPALTFGVTLVTLVVTAILREAASSLTTHRVRAERLAVLGRFSAQMAHDLKNPLAALVGAVQLLEDEETNNPEFRALIVEQAERIRAIVEQYDRLGRVEPVRSLVRLNELVRRVATASRHATSRRIVIAFELAPEFDACECDVDPDLVSGALENVVRNALEALEVFGEGGHEGTGPECEATTSGALTIRTRRDVRRDGRVVAAISVQDTGRGMDARQAERAFDDFYTTKGTGSGLGLAFVRRVALAHEGDASLVSKRGVGTTVEFRLATNERGARQVD